ncbi:hypothetical protein QKG26_gp089 [Chelonid alphaherpesvirus 5]|uniref:Uncharacterized protein n=1 Tax=Chelonid alphaherpesvirus 5 TaxID=702736 RepID=V5NWZ7_9ALPH|nr:hypothetical protein QKG26_gp089 [Chelonid alphaherpesvirus 5]AHA93375.1 hypothetical protein [Chelonid alphaherpesvirus 5]
MYYFLSDEPLRLNFQSTENAEDVYEWEDWLITNALVDDRFRALEIHHRVRCEGGHYYFVSLYERFRNARWKKPPPFSLLEYFAAGLSACLTSFYRPCAEVEPCVAFNISLAELRDAKWVRTAKNSTPGLAFHCHCSRPYGRYCEAQAVEILRVLSNFVMHPIHRPDGLCFRATSGNFVVLARQPIASHGYGAWSYEPHMLTPEENNSR